MKTPEQIAQEIGDRVGEDELPAVFAADEEPIIAPNTSRWLIQDLIVAAVKEGIEADRAQREPAVRHIIFTGPFEEAFSMDEATRRLEELLGEGHATPTVVNAALNNGEVIDLTARKIIDTAKAGEIR